MCIRTIYRNNIYDVFQYTFILKESHVYENSMELVGNFKGNNYLFILLYYNKNIHIYI